MNRIIKTAENQLRQKVIQKYRYLPRTQLIQDIREYMSMGPEMPERDDLR